jgi:poly-gamma-glutamate synthesis protein (capsule biosynthesis protein)
VLRVGAIAGLIVLAVGGVAAVRHGSPAAKAVAAETAPRVTSRLPAWVAPQARVSVAGFAGSERRVELLLGRRRVAATTSGRLGRFRLSFPAPRPGRYAVKVVSAGRAASVGPLAVRPVVLAAVGDVTTGEQVGASVDSLGAAYPWGWAGRELRAADLATANLEGAVSAGGVPVPDKEYHFRGPPALLRAARKAGGLDVLTVANNHSGDFGSSALLDTIRFARRAGLRVVGGGANEAAATRPSIVTVGGIRIAFVGFSDVNPYGFPATIDSAGTAEADPAVVAETVRTARARADVVVCWFHWGIELHADPTSRQRELADVALRAGAQVVLGAHPHVFGRVESRGAHGVVAWTLGNFVFPANSPSTVRTGILELRLDRQGVRAWRVTPARIEGFRPEAVAAASCRRSGCR